MTRRWLSVLLLALLICSPALAVSEYQSKVVRVLDGDTIEVLPNQHAERIRLRGIDCPEKGQAYGNNAKHAASALAFGKEVTLQTHGFDKYQRILADVILPDGMNLNQELVKDGWCWWYRKYAPGETTLERLEADAREGRKGLGRSAADTAVGVAETALGRLGVISESRPRRSFARRSFDKFARLSGCSA